MVLWIATMPPGLMPASTPASPLSTSRTSSSPTTHTHTKSLVAPSSDGVDAIFAGVPANGPNDAGLRAHSVRSKPPSLIRRAIGAPWLPSPMKPTRMTRPFRNHGSACQLGRGAVIAPGNCYSVVLKSFVSEPM
jgi:hypothetical protein